MSKRRKKIHLSFGDIQIIMIIITIVIVVFVGSYLHITRSDRIKEHRRKESFCDNVCEKEEFKIKGNNCICSNGTKYRIEK